MLLICEENEDIYYNVSIVHKEVSSGLFEGKWS
jgi:hypothetical protein